MSKKVIPPTKEEIKLGIKFFKERVALWESIGDDKEIKSWKKHLSDYARDPYGWKKGHYKHSDTKKKEK